MGRNCRRGGVSGGVVQKGGERRIGRFSEYFERDATRKEVEWPVVLGGVRDVMLKGLLASSEVCFGYRIDAVDPVLTGELEGRGIVLALGGGRERDKGKALWIRTAAGLQRADHPFYRAVRHDVVRMATDAVSRKRHHHVGSHGMDPFGNFFFEGERAKICEAAVWGFENGQGGKVERRGDLLKLAEAHLGHLCAGVAEALAVPGGLAPGERKQVNLVSFPALSNDARTRPKRLVIRMGKNVKEGAHCCIFLHEWSL